MAKKTYSVRLEYYAYPENGLSISDLETLLLSEPGVSIVSVDGANNRIKIQKNEYTRTVDGNSVRVNAG